MVLLFGEILSFSWCKDDMNLFDCQRIDRTLNEFHMKQIAQNLNNRRKLDNSKLNYIPLF